MTERSNIDNQQADPDPQPTFELNDEVVAGYLQDNPDFFLRQPALLSRLKIPHGERGTVSLVEIQLGRLRERVADLEEDITRLMGLATANEQLFRAFSIAHQSLFGAESEIDIQRTIATLAGSLNLAVSLRLYHDDSLNRKAVDSVRHGKFSGMGCYLGRLRKSEGELFVSQAPELGSYALVPVVKGKELGFLAFASKDGGHFQPSMDTLFLEQLAGHIAALLTKWQDG